ncbi:DUF4440 domain-containing protein [Actinomycetospora atypica]|uniref:DUF4440 domain-containing protein n=1 Tax=Actinomycetospora atypica TaxID=1290095 RepID=A0ABV9YJ30_9PSEU
MDEGIEILVKRLADALQRRDEAAFAECFGQTATVVADLYAVVTTDHAEFAAGLAGDWPFYEYLDVTRVEASVIEQVPLTPAMCRVRVRYRFGDANGRHLASGDFEYVMRHDDVGWRAYVAVNIDAEPRLQALARARGWTPTRSGPPPS